MWAPAATRREKAGRSAGRWHQEWERDDRGRARDFQVLMQTLFYVSAATHTCDEAARSAGFLCSSLSTVPCTSNYHGAAVWSPTGPSEQGRGGDLLPDPGPWIKTIATGSDLKIHAASSHFTTIVKNPCVRMTCVLTSIQDVPEEKKTPGTASIRGGSEAQEAARVKWREGLCVAAG